ncbi:MAG: hypothetical protein ACE5H9_04425 [Anaerolineae bacterium]
MYNHKFGFHINAISQPVEDAIMRLRPRVLKTLHHDVNFWRRIRQELPDTFIIGRLYEANQRFEDDPIRQGREFAEKVLREGVNQVEVNGRPIYNAWEAYNEIMPESASAGRQKQYDAFQVSFAERLRAGGFEPIGMNFATGNLLGHHFLNNFRGTMETYKYLGFHEYDWPTMDRLHKIGLADGNGGMWLCLRYRRTMQEVRREFPDHHLVFITECGMTQGVHPQGIGDVGPWHPSHPISPDDYWASLRWYNSELMKDDYLMGACLFVVGAISPWESFEHLGPIMDRLADFQVEITPVSRPGETATVVGAEARPSRAVSAGLGMTAVAPEPVAVPGPETTEPVPTPEPERPDPTRPPPEEVSQPETPPPDSIAITFPKAVADYQSHYILFPKGTEEWWYAAARRYLEHFGSSRGERLRDALFLRGAKGHIITCINPAPETVARIKKYHPTARLDIIEADSPGDLAAALNGRVKNNAPFG